MTKRAFQEGAQQDHIKKPEWLKVRAPVGRECQEMDRLLAELSLETVCSEAACPNRGECWAQRQVTVMIMGKRCTRNCRFCHVEAGRPLPLDPQEPLNVAKLAKHLGLAHIVVTSVTRDDVPDKGVAHFVQTVEALRKECPRATIEILTPDFKGAPHAADAMAKAEPDIFAHNIETVERLYPDVRIGACYTSSLQLLENVKTLNPAVMTKSSVMLGLGETDQELRKVLWDLRSHGVQGVTLGQYLQPTPQHAPVRRYVEAGEFAQWEAEAISMGFSMVFSGTFVRSSYRAGEALERARKREAENPKSDTFGPQTKCLRSCDAGHLRPCRGCDE